MVQLIIRRHGIDIKVSEHQFASRWIHYLSFAGAKLNSLSPKSNLQSGSPLLELDTRQATCSRANFVHGRDTLLLRCGRVGAVSVFRSVSCQGLTFFVYLFNRWRQFIQKLKLANEMSAFLRTRSANVQLPHWLYPDSPESNPNQSTYNVGSRIRAYHDRLFTSTYLDPDEMYLLMIEVFKWGIKILTK